MKLTSGNVGTSLEMSNGVDIEEALKIAP